jgi:hypothetical protein
MVDATVTETVRNGNMLDTLDPEYGSGITLDAALMQHEADVYEADPTGGTVSQYA